MALNATGESDVDQRNHDGEQAAEDNTVNRDMGTPIQFTQPYAEWQAMIVAKATFCLSAFTIAEMVIITMKDRITTIIPVVADTDPIAFER